MFFCIVGERLCGLPVLILFFSRVKVKAVFCLALLCINCNHLIHEIMKCTDMHKEYQHTTCSLLKATLHTQRKRCLKEVTPSTTYLQHTYTHKSLHRHCRRLERFSNYMHAHIHSKRTCVQNNIIYITPGNTHA
jgi:hypothetical protein